MPLTMQFVHDIAAPPEAVYEAMTDFDTWPHWMKGLVRIEPLTEGPFGVGTKWREVRKMMGQEAAEVFEVREAEPAKSLYLYCDGRLGSSKSGEYHFTYKFTPTASGTQLITDGEIRAGNAFMDFMGKLMGGTFKKAICGDLDAMKKHIESQPAA